MKIKKIFFGILALVLIAACSSRNEIRNSDPGAALANLDDFAKCLTQNNLIFYGAFWCQHCQNQKQMFGSSAQYINYIECSTPDGSGQTQACTDAGIKAYPTWEFKDGSRAEGEMTMAQLSQKSGCSLPQTG